MLSPDESQQNAELRQAFVKTLQKRLETVLRRARRLRLQGWDINALTVFYSDVQALAGACGRYGILEAGELLFSIENFLTPCMERLAFPDSEGQERFARLTELLEALVGRHAPRSTTPGAPMGSGALPDDKGLPLLVVPPPQYWMRWSNQAAAPAGGNAAVPAPGSAADSARPASSAAAASAAEAANAVSAVRQQAKPIQAAPEKRAYHLSGGTELSAEIDRQLQAAKHPTDVIDDVAELREMLGAFAPSMVIVDAEFVAQLDTIGDVLKLARSRASQKVSLVVFADNNDIATRLKAMRAGADAFLTLPMPAAEAMARIEELIDGSGGEPYRVLIIEDDRSQAMFAESILRKAGMETRSVAEPIAALEELNAFRPELILMDLYMPDCDGMELTTLIREREAYVNVPIVFLSGEHDEDKRFDALSAGGDDYLEKPIRPKHLISAVTNRVRRARATGRRVAALNPRDSVTGLYDRGHLLEKLSEALAAEDAFRREGGVLFLLVDGAQTIRERIGLTAFDQLMGEAGAYLAGMLQSRDLAARYGDTSFVVCVDAGHENELVKVAVRLSSAFNQHLFEVADRSLALALAIGVTSFAQNLGDAAAMVNAAERACVLARQNPERRVALFQTQISKAGDVDDEVLVGALREAIRNESFQLVFQPIASLRGSHDEQFQALLRLRGDAGRTYTAAVLIPCAERAGLIHGVDRWVLARTLLVVGERVREGRPVRLFVSQSSDSLGDPQRLAWLRQAIEARQVSGDLVVLEFRTADVLPRIRQMAAFQEGLRKLGVRLCLSAFDATMANFQLLQHVTPDYVKVAAKYTSVDGQTPKLRAELRQAITHLRERNIRVVAPLVEDAQAAASLWSTGVDYIQGNFVQQATHDLSFDFNASAL